MIPDRRGRSRSCFLLLYLLLMSRETFWLMLSSVCSSSLYFFPISEGHLQEFSHVLQKHKNGSSQGNKTPPRFRILNLLATRQEAFKGITLMCAETEVERSPTGFITASL